MTLFWGVKYTCVTERKEVSNVNSDPSENFIKELCEKGAIADMLEQYIISCDHPETTAQEGIASLDGISNTKKEKKQKTQKCSFPNLAGFCRYLNIGTDQLEALQDIYPEQYGRILAVLEDEALNSGISPTLISAYLKKRLGYESPSKRNHREEQLQISFEHNIFEDGE